MQKVFQMARKSDNSAKIIQNNRLLYNGKVFSVDDLSETKLPIHELNQKENKDTIFFKGHLSPLSNFHPSPMEIDGICFNSVEQYYQAEKARRHGDEKALMAIMNEYDPAEIKITAKQITKLSTITKEESDKLDQTVMMRALREKFKIQRLKEFLLSTGRKNLAKASYGTTWGTGIDLYRRECTQTRYNGKNILGNMSMSIRDEIINQG